MSKEIEINSIKKEIASGNLIVIHGRPATGKSWLLAKLFESETILDKSSLGTMKEESKHPSDENDFNLILSSLSIGIDESQLCQTNYLSKITALSASQGKGIALSCQSMNNIPDAVLLNYTEAGKDVVSVHLTKWNSSLSSPEISITKSKTVTNIH